MKKYVAFTLMFTVALVGAASSTQAAVVYWVGTLGPGGTGDYTDGNSWSADLVNPYGTPPLSTDTHGLINDFGGGTPTISSAIAQAPATTGIAWDSAFGQLDVVPGGSIVVNDVIMGFDGNAAAAGVLNVNGNMTVGGTLHLGWNGGNGSNATINLTGGFLHLAFIPVFNHGVINLSDAGFFLINGDHTGADLVGNGWIQAPLPGQSIVETFNATHGRTEWRVEAVPEPATLALLGLSCLGGLMIRKRC